MNKTLDHLRRFMFVFSMVIITLITASVSANEVIITKGDSIPAGTAMNGVAYGNNTYIIVGSSGYILKSSDAENWSTVKDSTFLNETYNEVVFGNGVFVAVATNGKIVTSTNGTDWTVQSSGTTARLNDIKFINGAFYTVGMNGTVLTSSNGTSWTSVNVSAGSDNLMDIDYGNGRYAIGSRTSSGSGAYVYLSTTGATNSWSKVTVDLYGPGLNEITFLKDKFFIFSVDTKIFTSSDASSWSSFTNARLTSPNQVFHGVYDGSKYYLFGSSPEGEYGSVFTSIDGTNFTLQSKTAYIVAQNSAYVNGMYFQLGNEGFVVSTDGMNWGFTATHFNSVASNGTNYVAVGGISNGAQIFTSSDWQNWTNVTPSYVKPPLSGVTYGGGRYVAVGGVSGSNSMSATSSDGNEWTFGDTGVTDILRAVAFGNGNYVAVGINGRILSSVDGISWTSKDSGTGYHFYGVEYVNGYFVAVGGSTTLSGKVKVKYSLDGQSWTDASPNIVGHFHSIAYGGGKYVMVGRDNTSGSLKFFSVVASDITNSASYSSPVTAATTPHGDLGTAGYGGVAYANGVFVAIANGKALPYQAYVLTSEDGTSWTATDAKATGRLRGITYAGGDFKVVGMSDTKLTVRAGLSNSNPIISENTGLTLNQNSATTTINKEMLWATDAEQAAASLTYTVGTAPLKGTLKWKGTTVLSSSSSFTQADIDAGDITFTPSPGASGADSFTFNVSDGAGGSLNGQVFTISIMNVNDEPVGLPTITGTPAYG